MIPAQDENIIRIILLNERNVLVNSVRGSAIPFTAFPFLIWRKDKYSAVADIKIPGCAAADIGIKLERLVLCQHTNCINTAVGTVAERKIDNPILSSVWNRGLGYFFCQNTEAASLSSGK